MPTIGFVRHGITEWNVLRKAQGLSDIPLNETGIQQARAIARRLAAEENWDIIISSDLQRAAKTAEMIAAQLGLEDVIKDERLRELSGGEIEGTTEEDRQARWGEKWFDLALGMETGEAGAQRTIALMEEIVERYHGKKVLLVTHGGIIGNTFKQLFPERVKTTFIDNTSISIIEKVEKGWSCLLYNCSKHLQEEKT
ncbi:histidine phosphatase family protein [Cytobacillus purgationiresistens]|uniref:Phosphoglycerate mutase n=1 Tax=Cytobacillus purgationiresistens TaxID=863449 RepID=A0ABU0AJC3_9BACI|nr:histidine phosphatase family protein [Cytobacillus purgationiresistens]MDQ0271361.1 putative phosphoglycerate mutase [Cytobacillus purgationiresistens]